MPKRNLAWVALVLLAATACWLLLPHLRTRQGRIATSVFRPLADLYSKLDQKYVERLNDEQRKRLVEEAIKGAVKSLGDSHSEYFPPLDAKELWGELHGRFTGVGIEIEQPDGVVTVVSLVESSPAYVAGIMPGDQILKAGEKDCRQLSNRAVARLIRGRPGSKVTLTVRRPGVAEPLRFALTRTRIVINPVKGFRPDGGDGWDYLIRPPLAPNIGYVRVTGFVQSDNGSTMTAFDAALAGLRNAGAQGLIIDLRDDTGGVLSQAVRMVDRFVAGGVIVSQRGAHSQEVHRATGSGTLTDWPVVVLINKRSASASEIVAGSLAAHGRAVLVGQRTFGKGTTQEMIQLPGVGGGKALLKLTVAYLYLPDGRSFDRIRPPLDFGRPTTPDPPLAPERPRLAGVNPTVTIGLSPEEALAMNRCRRKLDPQLSSVPPATQPEGGPRRAGAPTTEPDEEAGPDAWAAELIRVDRQLTAAIEVLSDPVRYEALRARAPTTAAESF